LCIVNQTKVTNNIRFSTPNRTAVAYSRLVSTY